jgi:hypothetical protein
VTPGSYLTGDAYNGSTARTFAVDATTDATASKIVARDSSGDIFARYLNMSHSASTQNSDTVFYSSTDTYIRKNTAAGMRSSLGLANSATITASASAGNSTIVQRDSSGYIFANYFNTTPNDVTSGITKVCVETGNDGYIRHGTQAAVRSFLGLGAYAYKGDSSYNIHNGWLRENGDDANVKLFGNSRQMVFRTDGTSEYAGGIGGYPFAWMYGGDSSGNRRMLLNTSGQLWCSDYGWLHDKFAYKAGASSQNFSSKECYVQNWVRTQGNAGHYWEGSSNGSGWHIYPKDRADMYMRTGSGNGGLAFTVANTTVRGYIHCTTSNEIGFLNSGRSWSLRMDNSKNCFVYGNFQSQLGARIYGTEKTYNYPSAGNDYFTNGGNIQVDSPNLNFGLYVQNNIRASGIVVFSDRRIKSNIVDIHDTTALDQIRLLKPKYYEYKDKLKRGGSSVIGFVAQDVKEVLPRAVSVADGEIPNIYEIATISSGNTVTFTNFNTSTLDGLGTLITYLAEDKREALTITEVIDEHTVLVEEDLSEWGEQLFVWGQKVDDFHHLNKDYIFTVATAALQEVDRQQQSDKVRITTLETQLQAEKARTYELQKKVELLEMSHTSLIQRIEALENL